MLKNQGGNSDGVPNCFGQMFDAKAPECVGGHDPTYWNGQNRIREQCDWVPSCSVQTNAKLIPASNLVRHQQPQQPSSPFTKFLPPTGAQQPWRPPTQPYSHQQQQQPPQQQQQHMQPHWGSAHYGIPQYLTVREPSTTRSLVGRLGIEILRSLGKSFGHTIAHFFDVEAVGPRNNGQP